MSVKPYRLKKTIEERTKEHTWWSKADIIAMLRLPEKPTIQDRKMHLAGHLMYEMALRRQDAIELTYSHFMKEDKVRRDAYCIKFHCVKQNLERTIDISLNARQAVLDFRRMLEQTGTTVEDTDKLFKYGDADIFAASLKRYLKKN